MKKANFLSLLLLCALTASAQSQRSHMIGYGPTRILDTYISQEKFSGAGFSYLYIYEGQKPDKRWQNTIEHELDLSKSRDRGDNTSMLEGNYNLYWNRLASLVGASRPRQTSQTRPPRQPRLPSQSSQSSQPSTPSSPSQSSQPSDPSSPSQPSSPSFHLQAGLTANANLGFLYDMTTSNNPAQARLALNIMPTAVATYDFPIRQQQFALRYELNLPFVGIMFSPNYGQSYYEIFTQGNYDRNVVPTTFVSAPTFRQMLTLDWFLSEKWALRIGYLGNYMQADINHLKQHIYTHRVLLGFTRCL